MAVLPRLRPSKRPPPVPQRSQPGPSDLERWRIPLIFAAAALNGAVWAAVSAGVCAALGYVASLRLIVITVWVVTTGLTLLGIRAIALAGGTGRDAS